MSDTLKYKPVDDGWTNPRRYDVYVPEPGLHPGRWIGQVVYSYNRTKPIERWQVVGYEGEIFRTRKAAATRLAEIMEGST